MRNPPRPPGPPSTLSSSSGHGLVYGTHRPRGPQLAFTPESSDTGSAKRKTKIIIILGIALPVLACVIGIAAWAVTTDVLRINPRANDHAYNRFGHQGKTRIDNMQSRSDQDVDVFLLHGITPSTVPRPTTLKKPNKISSTTSSSAVEMMSTSQTMPSPKASDILSKLISDMPPPKNPKSFIVFSPIPDDQNPENQRKGRRFDGKVVLHDGDLVAEESMISEDKSQELGFRKVPFNKKMNPSVESSYALKPGMRPPVQKKIHAKDNRDNRNPRLLLPDIVSESPPNFIKLPPRAELVTFPTNSKHSVNGISRNGGITQPRSSRNFQQRNNLPVVQQNNNNGYQNFDKTNIALEQPPLRNTKQNYDNGQFRNPVQGYKPSFQQVSPPVFKTQGTSSQFQPMGPPSFTQQDPQPIPQQNQYKVQDNQQSNQYVMDSQRSPTFQTHQYIGSNHNQPITPQNSPQSSFSHNTYSQEINSPAGTGGPQYFAPPPQTFHTKINYDQSPSKYGPSSSVSTYEKVAQSSVDMGPDGTHHHHHHHHHHEPVPSSSDPIGEVNYSDVPRNNDADRLGSIGIGMGPSRGITVQIGGGGGGGGLSGLLPLGTLGIAKNILSALLPRPQLGLNSKVFLGVEVGKGTGFSIG